MHHERSARPKLRPRGILFAVAVLAVAAFWLFSPGERDEPPAIDAQADVQPIVADVPAPPPEPAIHWVDGVFQSKNPIYNQLQEQGLSAPAVHRLINALTPVYDFRKARPEHRWSLGFENDQITRFTLTVSPSEIYDVFDVTGEPRVETREIETMREWATVEGEIANSLFAALAHEPEGHVLAMKLANVFAWDIDFYQDPRTGDTFDFLIEKEYIVQDGEPVFIGYGNVLAARYFAARDTYTAFQYERRDGKTDYYSAEGKSLIRNVLRSPLKFRYVTDNYNPRRFHPILKKVRPHNGVDYAADRNTPVMAVADGKVVRAGRYGGAGIAVEIQHDGELLTQYFHLNGIHKSVRRGKRVRQGQTIGYVGKTGLATGYHLHFGMKKRGRYVNPLRQKFEPGKPVPKDELRDFHQRKGVLLAFLAPETTEPIVRIQNFFGRNPTTFSAR